MTPDEQQPGTEDGGRLRDHEVAEQLTAADAVLIALGRSSSDAGAVLATVAESARRLCRCQGVQIYLLHGDEFELAATVGLSPEFERYVAQHPIRRDRETMAGRVALTADPPGRRRTHRPRVRPSRRPADRRLPDLDLGAAHPRRRGGRRDQPVADQGRTV